MVQPCSGWRKEGLKNRGGWCANGGLLFKLERTRDLNLVDRATTGGLGGGGPDLYSK